MPGSLLAAIVLVTTLPAAPLALASPAHVKVGPMGTATSMNWSGYAATPSGGTYSEVSGSWQQPAVTCSSTDSTVLFWVGIDGYTSSSAEQVGSLAACRNGVASYYTWWEMFPSGIQIVGTKVRPGSPLHASVVRHGSTYTLSMQDHSNRDNSFRVTQFCSTCENNSVEWVAERTSASGVFQDMADFGKMGFSRARAVSNKADGSIARFPYDVITMINADGDELARPGNLKQHGSKFSVTWLQIG